MRFLRQKKANFLPTILLPRLPRPISLDHHPSFSVVPPCLFLQQTTNIYIVNVNKPIEIPEGLIIDPLFGLQVDGLTTGRGA